MPTLPCALRALGPTVRRSIRVSIHIRGSSICDIDNAPQMLSADLMRLRSLYSGVSRELAFDLSVERWGEVSIMSTLINDISKGHVSQPACGGPQSCGTSKTGQTKE